MADVQGLIFANMHDSTINELTERRTMASVPFGARYRLIDFMLSNMANSGIAEVGVITKSNYQSLLDHLGMGREWDLSRKNKGLHLLPPFGHSGSGIYRGRLEALANVMSYIKQSDAEYVVMSDSDILANIDLKPAVDFHEKNDADITVVYGKRFCAMEQSRTKTVLFVNEENRVYDVLVRPEISGEINVSLNIYVMKKKFLEDLINDTTSRSLYSFEVDVLQHRLKQLKICGWRYDGFFMQIDSMKSYYEGNLSLIKPEVRKSLFTADDPIYTKVRDEAPAKYGLDANVKNVVAADGCIIEGTVENSVLFRGVKIKKGAIVRNSVIMQDTVIGEGADINYVITDKKVLISDKRTLIGTENYPIFVKKGASI